MSWKSVTIDGQEVKKITLDGKKLFEKKTIDLDTILLLDGESLEDKSSYHIPLQITNVSISSTRSKFGNSSMYFNTRGNGIKVNLSSYFSSNSPFTFDFWIYPTSIVNYNTCISIGPNGSNEYETYGGVVSYGATAIYSYYASGNRITGNRTINANAWNHVAFVCNGSRMKLFINGIQSGSDYNRGGNFKWNTIQIGVNGASADEYLRGYIDEFRISKVERWSSNFTPPTEPY